MAEGDAERSSTEGREVVRARGGADAEHAQAVSADRSRVDALAGAERRRGVARTGLGGASAPQEVRAAGEEWK